MTWPISIRTRVNSVLKVVLFAMVSLQSTVGLGQALTIQELLAQKEQWPTFAVDGRKFQFEGRFEGRTGDTIRIVKFDIVCHLPSSGTFPERIRSGQRIDITGRFLSDGGRLSFVVTRIIIRDTDIDRLRSRAQEIPADQPAKLIDLAAEYQADADFYADTVLQTEITAMRTNGVQRQRKLARGDATKLRELLQQATALGVKSELLQLLRFETIYESAKNPMADVETLLAEVKLSCEGWDQIVPPVPDRLRLSFEKSAVTAFDAAAQADRHGLHRLLYKSLRLRQFQSMITKDGSNGLEISKLIRTEFGDDDTLAAEFEEREVRFRLETLTTLSRGELKSLTELLVRLNRAAKVPEVAQTWVQAQEQKFGTSNLAAVLRTADEYLFVAELMQSRDDEQKGADLLKQAWTMSREISPTDADQIVDRLRRLGWERLNNQWITAKQMNSLPKDDVQMAIREGRVVCGMTVQQVVQTLGQPTKISRIASRKSVCEMWSYEAAGFAGMVIRFRRNPSDTATASLVEDVSRVPQRSSR
ncbi:MAG TPA: hypothetical protein PLR25_14945 [Planctomycetaceae bacterium]|nr:hypothetical protein [Planctomycetaceae bacterium]